MALTHPLNPPELPSHCTLPPGSHCSKHNPHPPNSFQSLISTITDILGPSSGLDSTDIDVNDLKSAMRSYQSHEAEWAEYAHKDLSRNYTRNFVDRGNGNANMLILVWTPGKGSLVHDHANAHCIMKVLKGKLKETLYEMPSVPDTPLTVTRSTVYNSDEVTYISDDIGLHKIENPDPENIAVSLHIYTPPWAEQHGCYCFSEKTGKKTKVQMKNYYSVNGLIESKKPQSC
ncbi:hypothetical protein EX30DRAFT_354505 [Ascodesmis nigricans]|uniref:Cysteine dioxygenase n=1 Tax=Ascodesmis nigricans TaxID=341454 RepID=A0A4S2N2S8_9PEZI|nr:hypothetical protein EX30DRAFT_354505 [Ascodesmis nigricans]